MHYGLYREKSFETFPGEFLKVDVNAYVYGTYLLPWNWEWLVIPFTAPMTGWRRSMTG
jgi:NTE family protein